MSKWLRHSESEIDWKKFDNGLVASIDNITLIIPHHAMENFTPIFCPICDLPMLTADDSASYAEFSCCEECKLRWAESRREEWKHGWRPVESDLKDYVDQRRNSRSSIRV